MSDNQIVNIDELTADPLNANKGTAAGQSMVDESFAKLGAGRSVLLDSGGGLIAGHKSTNGARAAGIQTVRIIETDGTELIAVKRTDIKAGSDEAKLLGLADNQTAHAGLEFNYDIIDGMVADGLDVGWMFEEFQIGDFSADFADGLEYEEEAGGVDVPLLHGVPDTIWPSDNDYGIPVLSLERQADAFDLPIETWGAKGRSRAAGTYHFYTEDGRFSALWSKPNQPIDAGVVNLVEPNYSLYKDFPVAVAIYRTYQKRWLARYWQSQGARIFVDMNVHPSYHAVNLLGVPDGWTAYATRGYSDRLELTEGEMRAARARAGVDDILFMVYGGGAKVKQWCQDNGAVWVAEDMDRAKGRYSEVIYGEK